VNLTLTKRGDYAVRSAICLGRAYTSGTPRKLRQVSAEMAIPRTFVSQILGDLVHAQIAVSSFGTNGGYRLARPPEQVSLLEVVEAAEGRLAHDECVVGEGPCHWQRVCPLHGSWTELVSSTRALLARTSLAELADRDARLEAGTFLVPADAHRLQALTVTVAESVTVELPAAVLAGRISAGGSWLVPHLQAASAAGDALRVRVGPGGPAWLGKTVAVHLGEPHGFDGGLELSLAWEATGPSALFPRFDGALRLAPLDEDRAELSLLGRYRPPLGVAGQVLDEALLARVARATVRTLLRRVGRVLEDGVPLPEP
jgi:Rrf2 family protein